MRVKLSAAAAGLIAAAVLWAGGTVLTKAALQDWAPLKLLAMELATSCLALWVLVWQSGERLPRWRDAGTLGWTGVLQPGLYYVLIFLALQWTTASMEALIAATEGMVMLPFSALLLRERVAGGTAFWGAVGLGGVGMAVMPLRLGTNEVLGEGLVFLGVLVACSYTVGTRRVMERFSPLVVLTVQQTAGLPFTLAAAMLVRQGGAAWPTDVRSLATAVIGGMILLCIPFLLFLTGIQRLGSARAVQYLPLVPVCSIAMARVALGERLFWYQYVGAAITVVATMLLAAAEGRYADRENPS